jgi:hypothetical protein
MNGYFLNLSGGALYKIPKKRKRRDEIKGMGFRGDERIENNSVRIDEIKIRNEVCFLVIKPLAMG